MNLTEANYLIRMLTKFRLPSGMASTFSEEDGTPDYLVFLRKDEIQGPVDLADLGQALWMLGYRMMLTPQGVINFEKGPRLLDAPMEDPDEPVAQPEEVEDPFPAGRFPDPDKFRVWAEWRP